MTNWFARIWQWIRRKLGFRDEAYYDSQDIVVSGANVRRFTANQTLPGIKPTQPWPQREVTRNVEERRSSTGDVIASSTVVDAALDVTAIYAMTSRPASSTPTPVANTPVEDFRTGGVVQDSGFRTGGTDSSPDWTPSKSESPSYESKVDTSSSYSSSDSGSSSSSSSSE